MKIFEERRKIMFDTLMLKGIMLMNGFLATTPAPAPGGGGGGGTGTTDWTISKFLDALQQSIGNYVKIIIMIIGLVMVGFGIYQIAKNLISGGKGQTNWVTTFLLIIVGGTLMLSGGWEVIRHFSGGSKTTLDNMGQGKADNAAGGGVNSKGHFD